MVIHPADNIATNFEDCMAVKFINYGAFCACTLRDLVTFDLDIASPVTLAIVNCVENTNFL